MTVSIETFFREHPIFTHADFEGFVGRRGNRSPNTVTNMIKQHLDAGHIVRIKRGLYASIPYGADAKIHPINPFLVAGSLAEDAVVAYHSALAFHGFAYSSSYRFIYLTKHKPKSLEFRGETYQPSVFPSSLLKNNQAHSYVNIEDIQGAGIQVASRERTLVDVLDRPLLGGGWEEVWRSLDMIERLKVANVVEYTLLLGNATTIAKVGFYLEQRKKDFSVDSKQLETLRKHSPISPHYMGDMEKEQYRFIKAWNLMVPLSLINRDWEEELGWEPKL